VPLAGKQPAGFAIAEAMPLLARDFSDFKKKLCEFPSFWKNPH
jgi:hypothetical protein